MDQKYLKIALTVAECADTGAPIVLRGPYDKSFKRACSMGYDSVKLHLSRADEVHAGGETEPFGLPFRNEHGGVQLVEGFAIGPLARGL